MDGEKSLLKNCILTEMACFGWEDRKENQVPFNDIKFAQYLT